MVENFLNSKNMQKVLNLPNEGRPIFFTPKGGVTCYGTFEGDHFRSDHENKQVYRPDEVESWEYEISELSVNPDLLKQNDSQHSDAGGSQQA